MERPGGFVTINILSRNKVTAVLCPLESRLTGGMVSQKEPNKPGNDDENQSYDYGRQE